MFYGKHAEKPLFLLRKMIASNTEAERRKALDELFPFMKADMKGTLEAMDGYPVTIRTLDPPLHEFIPHNPEGRHKIAESLGISREEFDKRADALQRDKSHDGTPGVRLGITFPEITETQVKAISKLRLNFSREKTSFPRDYDPGNLQCE